MDYTDLLVGLGTDMYRLVLCLSAVLGLGCGVLFWRDVLK